MAIVGNSYLYHMRKDLVENIEPGVAQHMGENALALISYLASDKSPIPDLASGYSKPRTVYFTYIGRLFFSYSFATAKIMYGLLFLASVALVKFTFTEPIPKGSGLWTAQGNAAKATCLGVAGTFIAPNVVAVLMRNVLHKNLSWFSDPLAPLLLYGPACLLGMFSFLTTELSKSDS
jgi:hypothetical protein